MGKNFGYESEAMTSEPIETALPQSSFAKLLATGVVGWILGSLVLIATGWYWEHSETIAVSAMWAISHWWAAFAFGAVLLLVDSALSRLKPATALMAYLMPVALLAVAAGICTAIYPEPGFRSDLFGYMALVVVFYVVGFLWMVLGRGSPGNTAFLRQVLPAMVGGLIVLGLIAVPVFTSNPFIYRNAFGLSVSKASVANGTMVAEGVLEIHKPGKYAFSAPRYIYGGQTGASDMEPAMEYGKITWGAAGPPKDDAEGNYPFQVLWVKNVPASQPAPTAADVERETISLEVSDSAKQGSEPIFSIYAPLPIARQ